jgi:hypothetical protein
MAAIVGVANVVALWSAPTCVCDEGGLGQTGTRGDLDCGGVVLCIAFIYALKHNLMTALYQLQL